MNQGSGNSIYEELVAGISFGGVSGIINGQGAPWKPRTEGPLIYELKNVDADYVVTNVMDFNQVSEID